MNKMSIRITGIIASMLLAAGSITGCVSGADSQESDPLLFSLLPVYTDGSLDYAINGSDEYTITHFDPAQYTLYDSKGEVLDPLTEESLVPNVNLELSLDILNAPKDVYFIFTNVSPSAGTSYPSLSDPGLSVQQGLVPAAGAPAKADAVPADAFGTRGKPEATEFNRNPYASLNSKNPVSLLLNLVPSIEPLYDTADDTGYFKIDAYTSVKATCRFADTVTVASTFGDADNNKTLNIWVADNCWTDTGTKKALVEQTMVDAMADKFLKDGLTNDIYDWVTAIYGEEWGDVPFSSPLTEQDRTMLITPDNEITILLFDIDNDNSTSGGVLGYFWAKDNFKASALPHSNERVMFYLDAVLFATNVGTWDITDRWPSEIISTLAHEFQHMIQFYQKTVSRTDGSSGTETWIDEMCSLATEDLVSNKLGVNGPRGADYTSAACVPDTDDLVPGGYITYGRLPIANYFNEYSVTTWYSGSYRLISYSLNYALGAYLARNYGGAEFFRNVVWNGYTDYRAIEYALDQVSPALPVENGKFGSVLRRWAASTLLSDKDDTDSYYQYYEYNRDLYDDLFDDWFYSNSSSLVYTLGSIDMHKYRYSYQSGSYYYGPYIYDVMRSGAMPAASNIYYRAGKNLSGAQTWNITLMSNVRLTVVARDALPAHP